MNDLGQRPSAKPRSLLRALAGTCALCLPVVAGPAAAPASGAPLFAQAVSYATGGRANCVAVGDLNSDGIPDLAVANNSDSTVSILLGHGDGTFGPKHDLVTGLFPNNVAAGDLNNDGSLDLVVTRSVDTNPTQYFVTVLLGSGGGSFAPRHDLPAGVHPYSVAIGDLNGDGKPDLAVTLDAGAISVYLGHGDGSFAPRVDYPATDGPMSVAIDDVNGDGLPDLTTANLGQFGVSVLLGLGTGAFSAASYYAAGSGPYFGALGDLNGDGNLDLVVANHTSNDVSVLLGNGDGSFGPHTDYGGHRGASCVAVGDLDGDGKVDLAVADQEADSVSVRLGNGDGTFRSRTACGVGIFPAFVVIQDLDGDGRRDLVVANYFSNSASVLRNVGATVSIRPPGAPSRFALSAPSPNPFHSSARFEIAMSEAAPVQFEIYDLTGRRIKVLEDGVLGAGRQTRFWDGFAADGTQAAVGVYLARFSAPGFERSTKVVVVR